MASQDSPSGAQDPILETVPLEHMPPTHTVHVAVYRDVANAAFLHQQLLSRNADFEYAFIDATSITSRLQVLAAVYKAITAQLSGAMKTPNIHSETVCSLSPNNNHLRAHVRGTPLPFTDAALGGLTDWPKVRKYYKLNGVGCLDGLADEAQRRRETELLVLGGMALRGL
ncbi:hypothetical protein AAE478_009805 [Parahypoxylon ruwenzoriense]